MTSRWQFSSSGWRNPSNPWFRVGQVEVTTTLLVVIIGVVSMFFYAASSATFEPFYFATPLIRDGELWRVLSWPLVNAPSLSAVIAIAMFYFFGRELEAQFGRNRFVSFLALVVVVPSVIVTLISFLGDGRFETGAAGLRLVEFAVFAAYVSERPFARFFFGIPGWVLFVVIFGIDVLQLVAERFWLALILELLMVGLAALIMRAWGFADDLHWLPRLAIPGGPNTRRTKAPKKARRRTSPSKGAGTVVSGPWPSDSTATGGDQRALDDLLDKVASKGLDGLSSAERKQLDELSRKMRGQH